MIISPAPPALAPKLKAEIKASTLVYFEGKTEADVNAYKQHVLDPIFRTYNVDYKQFAPSLKRFAELCLADIIRLFPRTVNGGVQQYCAPVAGAAPAETEQSSSHALFVRLFTEMIQGNGGRFLLSSIGPQLSSKYGIDYKEYSEGKTLQTWLKSAFVEEFAIDGNHLLLADDQKEADKAVPREVSQMHKLAFMLWWSNHARTLNRCTGENKTPDEWSLTVARGLSLALLGAAPSFTYDSEEGRKFVFNTTVKTANGNNLYCVLRPNAQANNGRQYLFEGFCCVAEEDTELCKEVKLGVPEILRFDNVLEDKYEELKLDLGLLQQSRELLLTVWPSLTERMQTGAALDGDTFSQLRVYHSRWQHVLDVAEAIGWEADGLTLDTLAQLLESGNRKNDVLNAAVGDTIVFLESLQPFFKTFNQAMLAAVEKDIETVGELTWERVAEFKELLARYVRLMKATEITEFGDEVFTATEEFNRDFGCALSERVFFGLFRGAGEEWNKAVPANVLLRLSAEDVPEEEPTEYTADTAVLLERMAAKDGTTSAALLENAGRIRLTRLEKAIALGNFERAKTLVASGEAAEDSRLSAEELQHVLDELTTDDVSLSLYDCAMRLYQTLGNVHRLAETYFLFGAFLGEADCLEPLLELYINDNESESFFALWNGLETHPVPTADKIRPLLYMLATKGEDVLTAYLNEHLAIFYAPAYANALAEVLGDFNFPALLVRAERCAAHLADDTEMNEFEKLVLEATDKKDIDAVLHYLPTFAQSAAELGYTDEELQQITETLSAQQLDQEEITPAARLYALQKNKNGTAERVLWAELLQRGTLRECLALLVILNDEGRYEELCTLFEAYASQLAKNPDARALYILGLVHTQTDTLPSFVYDNLQDALLLMVDGRWPNETAEIYAPVSALQQYLEDPVARSIATLAYDLISMATDTDKLTAFGLDEAQRESFVSVYRTGAFPRGRDPLSIAQRLRAFGGIRHAMTFALATWGMERGKPSAPSLLWEIYSATDQSEKGLKLLRSHPSLRKGREEEFLSLLIKHGCYEEFLFETAALTEKTPLQTAQTVIAKCYAERHADDELAALQQTITELPAATVADTVEAMLVNGVSAASLLAAPLETLLSQLTAAELKAVVTGNGHATEEQLKALLKALSTDDKAAAIYLFETFGIGRMKKASEAYFNETLQTLDEQPDRDATLRLLKTVYAENKHYTVLLLLHEIADTGLSDDNRDTVCRRIENAMEGVDLSHEDMLQCMELFKTHALPLSGKTVAAFVKSCEENGTADDCIAFFGTLPPTSQSEDVLFALCEMYAAALAEERFREEWYQNAKHTFALMLHTERALTAALGAYLLQARYGNEHLATVSLFMLLEKLNDASAEQREAIKATLNKLGQTLPLSSDTTLSELFEQMAIVSSVEEIQAYCAYCTPYVADIVEPEKFYGEIKNEEEAEAYSSDTEAKLIKLLYSDPQNGNYWRLCAGIPWDDPTDVCAKLLYIAAMLSRPNEKLWNRCVDACERTTDDELLARALVDCAKHTPLPYALQGLRKRLVDQLESNVLYFQRLDKASADELVTVLCRRSADELKSGANAVHNILRDLSAIAVATGSDEAYETMLTFTRPHFLNGNVSLCFALVCRLLLEKRFTQAAALLAELPTAGAKYANLMDKLGAMSEKELEAFCADESNNTLLELILPNGNTPDIRTINNMVLDFVAEEKFEQGAQLLCKLLEEQKTDYGCYMGLFILSKYLPERPELLHKALFGMLVNAPKGNSKGYYSRGKRDYAILLANLNAVLEEQKKTEAVSVFDGYDFSLSVGEHYQNCDPTAVGLVQIQRAHDNIAATLLNQTEKVKDILYSMVFGYVTANWYDFFLKCFRGNEDPFLYLACYEADSEHFDGGMLRSILRLAYELEDGAKFMTFLQSCEDTVLAEGKKLYTPIEHALSLYKQQLYLNLPQTMFEGHFLLLPFEEKSVLEPCFRSTVSRIVDEAPHATYSCAMLVGSISASNSVMSELWQAAMEAFEEADDRTASLLFSVLRSLNKTYKIYNGAPPSHTSEPTETYEALMRVSGAFAGDETILNKIKGENFHTWSCLNMALQLLYSKRAGEIDRLRGLLSEANTELVDALLTLVSDTASDDDKISAILAVRDEVGRGLLCYIARWWNTKESCYYVLKEKISADILKKQLIEVTANNDKLFLYSPPETFKVRHFLCWKPENINKERGVAASKPKAVSTQQDTAPEVISTPETTVSVQSLSFVTALEPLLEAPDTPEALQAARSKFTRIGAQNNQARLELSEQLYRMALAREADAVALVDAALDYGVDLYYVYLDGNEYAKARNILLEMAAVYTPAAKGVGAQALKEAVCRTALYNLLNNSYTSVCEMAEAYANHKPQFAKLRAMLPSQMEEEAQNVTRVYNALALIAERLEEAAHGQSDALREALSEAHARVKSSQNTKWNKLCETLSMLIQKEIGRLNRHPRLEITVFDKTVPSNFGYLYGLVKNIGGDAAEEVTLRLDCNNGYVSEPHALPRLEKGEEAAFEIYYTSPAGTAQLTYELSAIYHNNKAESYLQHQKGLLTVEAAEEADLPTELFSDTDKTIDLKDFILQPNGSVVNENFFGRRAELGTVHSIFVEGGFSHYKNMLVKGIRRAGKTSVLNYLIAYARLKCDDAVAVYVDCSSVNGAGTPVRDIFVERVIAECRALNPDAAWDVLEQKWKTSMADCRSADLQYFYRELKEYNGGRGLLLVLDEFDILLEQVETHQGMDAINGMLLPSLRELINSANCQDAVHLVICGSNKLIRYNDAVTYNQFFEQFGTNVMPIGHFPKRDMEDMIKSACEKHPAITFPQETVDWVWKYTSGMVWYSKMLVNVALNRAVSLGRSTVYPYDVAEAVVSLVAKSFLFKSVLENCLPNERRMLDALQSLTATATEYVTVTRLSELLADEFTSEELGGFIRALENIQILERRGASVRFATELYWHFFREHFSSSNSYKQRAELPAVFKENN